MVVIQLKGSNPFYPVYGKFSYNRNKISFLLLFIKYFYYFWIKGLTISIPRGIKYTLIIFSVIKMVIYFIKKSNSFI